MTTAFVIAASDDLAQNEAMMPDGEELYRRILTTHNVVEEDGSSLA